MCTLEHCSTSFCPELSQQTDPELRDRELRLLLATQRNLPLQIALQTDLLSV